MQASKLFIVAALSVIAMDVAASFASSILGFPYSYAAIGSAFLYMGFAYFAARTLGLWVALLLGAAMGITDVTLGWAVSWAIGPGRIPVDNLTLTDWFFTGVFATVLGAIYGLIGGSIGALVARRRAA